MIEDIRKKVRERYAGVAAKSGSCCGPATSCGCSQPTEKDLSVAAGYSAAELSSIPQGANLGLGCGNPVALASLREGEVVLDLGSGGGIDCFLAARKVGPTGRVIGVDMTPEMIHLARENAQKSGIANTDFRLGEIENLPVADHSIDVAISNCVINLSPDKERVFREIFRVLKPGGRMMVSDIVLIGELPERVKESVVAYTQCIGGAMPRQEYLDAIEKAGFDQVKVTAENGVPVDLWAEFPIPEADPPISKDEVRKILAAVVSIKVYAQKR